MKQIGIEPGGRSTQRSHQTEVVLKRHICNWFSYHLRCSHQTEVVLKLDDDEAWKQEYLWFPSNRSGFETMSPTIFMPVLVLLPLYELFGIKLGGFLIG
ncbi:MAG: hypothetical protein EOL88_10825 [Bacteroidia bacterium]|nr:hypothetical protein [Bacteroidia bacterium]